MASKYDKHCDFCQCVVENKKGVVKPFIVRNFGDEKTPKYRKVCNTCDNKNKELYKQ